MPLKMREWRPRTRLVIPQWNTAIAVSRVTLGLFLAGAGGVVGRHLIPLLLADGWSLTGTTRSPDKAKQLAALGIHPTSSTCSMRPHFVRLSAPSQSTRQSGCWAGFRGMARG